MEIRINATYIWNKEVFRTEVESSTSEPKYFEPKLTNSSQGVLGNEVKKPRVAFGHKHGQGTSVKK